MAEWQVTNNEFGFSLLSFIKSKTLEEISLRQIKQAIDAGKCRVNGKVQRFSSTLVGKGDSIAFDGIVRRKAILTEKDINKNILYSDEDILAYNKPSGLSSEDKLLNSLLRNQFKTITLLHRLDKETSGVLLFAKTDKTAKAMLDLFKGREIVKTYLALVDNIPTQASGVIENYLGKLHVYQGQTLWGPISADKGLWACTRWNLLKTGKEAALLECRPETGRTHQIRVHLSGIGHPILGDHQYGRLFQCHYRPQRILLHAKEISFVHPQSKQKLIISSPTPKDFREAVEQLLKFSL